MAGEHPRDPGRHLPVGCVVLLVTLAACVAAVVFRTAIRSRFWAWQVIRSQRLEHRAVPLGLLCNAGDAGRWGIRTLLEHRDAEIRQLGVLVLHHVRGDWSRGQLLRMLGDPDARVRELAAVGLAIHGDAIVIPRLKKLYLTGDTAVGVAACLALERLASPPAVAALAELARRPADPARRAALVDALAAIGTPQCAAVLLELLDDHRPSGVPTRAESVLARLGPVLAEKGLLPEPASAQATRLTSAPAGQTVAERAAEALARITGLSPPFGSDLPPAEREAAARLWQEWLGSQNAQRQRQAPAERAPGNGEP